MYYGSYICVYVSLREIFVSKGSLRINPAYLFIIKHHGNVSVRVRAGTEGDPLWGLKKRMGMKDDTSIEHSFIRSTMLSSILFFLFFSFLSFSLLFRRGEKEESFSIPFKWLFTPFVHAYIFVLWKKLAYLDNIRDMLTICWMNSFVDKLYDTISSIMMTNF